MFLTDTELKAWNRAILEKIIAIYNKDKNEWLTNSASSSGFHRIRTIHGKEMCDCTGFSRWGMCKHIASVHLEMLENGMAEFCPECNEFLTNRTPITVEEFENAYFQRI